MANSVTRTAVAEFVLRNDEDGSEIRRVKQGERVELTTAQFERAVKAECVLKDEAADKKVAVRNPDPETPAPVRQRQRDGRARAVRTAEKRGFSKSTASAKGKSKSK